MPASSAVTFFAQRPRDEWAALLAETDACVAPVLDLEEAPRHPHNVARRAFVEIDGAPQPAPAPRFSRTPAEVGRTSARRGEHSEDILRENGFSPAEIDALKRAGAL